MQPRQLFILAILLMIGAAVSTVLPEHPLFNQAEGKYVLSAMALACAATGIHVKLRPRTKGSRV